MWVSTQDTRPEPMKDGLYRFYLRFGNYYGYNTKWNKMNVIAKWDDLNDYFREAETNIEILDDDIVAWWKE